MIDLSASALGGVTRAVTQVAGEVTEGLAHIHGAEPPAAEEIKQRSPDLSDVLLGDRLITLLGETLAAARVRLRKAKVTGMWTGAHHWIRTLHGRTALLEISPKVLKDPNQKNSVSMLGPGLAFPVGGQKVEAIFVFSDVKEIDPGFLGLPFVWQNSKFVKQAGFFHHPHLALLDSYGADRRIAELSTWLNVDPSAEAEPVHLTGPQIGKVHKKVKKNFNAESLERLLHFKLDKRLSDFAQGPFDDALKDVLDHANEEGWMGKLFLAIWKERPDLRDFLDQF